MSAALVFEEEAEHPNFGTQLPLILPLIAKTGLLFHNGLATLDHTVLLPSSLPGQQRDLVLHEWRETVMSSTRALDAQLQQEIDRREAAELDNVQLRAQIAQQAANARVAPPTKLASVSTCSNPQKGGMIGGKFAGVSSYVQVKPAPHPSLQAPPAPPSARAAAGSAPVKGKGMASASYAEKLTAPAPTPTPAPPATPAASGTPPGKLRRTAPIPTAKQL